MKIKVSYPVLVLVFIIEECAEIIQRACKAIRFGLDERWKPTDPTNKDMMQGEINDLVGVIALAKKHGILPQQNIHEEALAAEKKIAKVEKFTAYSRDVCKTVIETDNLEDNQPACYQVFKETLQSPLPQKD
jgi:hypothetical protein